MSKDSSESFINHHRLERPHSPRIHLNQGQIEAMSQALTSFGAAETGEYVARDDVEGFLQEHWGAPIPPQSSAPVVLDSLTSELVPDACGACHVSQWRDWKASLHSRSMGPGIMGQLKNGLMEEKPGSASMCQGCHAPLWEQHLKVPGVGGYRTNPDYRADLQSSGLSCATCHVRGHRRFGPSPGAETSAQVWGTGHGGAVVRTAFLSDLSSVGSVTSSPRPERESMESSSKIRIMNGWLHPKADGGRHAKPATCRCVVTFGSAFTIRK